MGIGRQRGQAAVEGIGVTVLVALLVAATAVWLLREAHPPAAPPPVIAVAAAPLRAPYDSGIWAPAPALVFRGLSSPARGSRPIGRALRAVGRGIVTAVGVEREAEGAFHDGARERLRQRTRDFLDDPIGSLLTPPDPMMLTPAGVVARTVDDARGLWDYADRVRTLPPREAMRVVAHDAGAAAADIAIDVAQALLRRGVSRAVRRSLPQNRRSGEETPAP